MWPLVFFLTQRHEGTEKTLLRTPVPPCENNTPRNCGLWPQAATTGRSSSGGCSSKYSPCSSVFSLAKHKFKAGQALLRISEYSGGGEAISGLFPETPL